MNRFNKPKFGPKSYRSSLAGISNYIQRFHKNLLPEKIEPKGYAKYLNFIMIDFLYDKDIEHRKFEPGSDMFNANMVQEHFPRFRRHLKQLSKDLRNEKD